MAIFRDMYEGIYGHKPNIMVIHAGLECGLFKEPYPNMDMVSFGPTIKFPHSPDEKVKIDTVAAILGSNGCTSRSNSRKSVILTRYDKY